MRYRPELDGLRAVAIGAVLILHGSYSNIPGGFLGVDLFFVLSGFLITALLIEERVANGYVSITSFYWRRVLRIFPPIFIGVLLFIFLREPSNNLYHAIPAILFFYANYVDELGVMSHTWSLSVEEQFYLVWPLVFVLLSRKRVSLLAIASLLIAAIIAAMAIRTGGILAGMDHELMYRASVTRADSLAMGCLGGILTKMGTLHLPTSLANRLLWLCAVLFAIACLTVKVTDPWVTTGGLTGFAFLFFVLIISV
jgi:peptidoglycan/LPS O-acetylase OafA/YrhL